MTVGFFFGGFWAGLGVLLWWWPAAIFVAFSNEDVTPGARAFAVGSILIGMAFLSLEFPRVGLAASLPATVGVVGLLQMLHPVGGPAPLDGRVLARHSGAVLLVAGLAGTFLLIV